MLNLAGIFLHRVLYSRHTIQQNILFRQFLPEIDSHHTRSLEFHSKFVFSLYTFLPLAFYARTT